MNLDDEFEKMYGGSGAASAAPDLDDEFDKLYSGTNDEPKSRAWEDGDGGSAKLPDGETNEWGGNLRNEGRKVLFRLDKAGKVNGYSTTNSMLVKDNDGKIAVIPTVVDGKELSSDDAVRHYAETGEHWGKSDDEASARKMAQAIHERHASDNQKSWNDYIHAHWGDMSDGIKNDPRTRYQHKKRTGEETSLMERLANDDAEEDVKAWKSGSDESDEMMINSMGQAIGKKRISREGKTDKDALAGLAKEAGLPDWQIERIRRESKSVEEMRKNLAYVAGNRVSVSEDEDGNGYGPLTNTKIGRAVRQVAGSVTHAIADIVPKATRLAGTLLGGERDVDQPIMVDDKYSRKENEDVRQWARRKGIHLTSKNFDAWNEFFKWEAPIEGKEGMRESRSLMAPGNKTKSWDEKSFGDKLVAIADSEQADLEKYVPRHLTQSSVLNFVTDTVSGIGGFVFNGPLMVPTAGSDAYQNMREEALRAGKSEEYARNIGIGMAAFDTAMTAAFYAAPVKRWMSSKGIRPVETFKSGSYSDMRRSFGNYFAKQAIIDQSAAALEAGAIMGVQGAGDKLGEMLAQGKDVDLGDIVITGVEGAAEGVAVGLVMGAAHIIGARHAGRKYYDTTLRDAVKTPEGVVALARLNPEGTAAFCEAFERGGIASAKVADAAGLPPMKAAELVNYYQKLKQLGISSDVIRKNTKIGGPKPEAPVGGEVPPSDDLSNIIRGKGHDPIKFRIPQTEDGKPKFTLMAWRDNNTGSEGKNRVAIDENAGVAIIDNGDGTFTTYDNLQNAVDADSLEGAIENANELALAQQLNDIERGQKSEVIEKERARNYGTKTVKTFPTMADAVNQIGAAIQNGDKKNSFGITSIENFTNPKFGFKMDRKAFHTPDGTTVMILDNIDNPSDVPRILRHEFIGHGGPNDEYGKNLDEFLASLDEKDFPAIAGTDDPRAKREYFANMLQTREHNATLKQKIASWLGKKLGKKTVSANDVEVLATKWEQAVRGEGGEFIPGEAGDRFEFIELDEEATPTSAAEAPESAPVSTPSETATTTQTEETKLAEKTEKPSAEKPASPAPTKENSEDVNKRREGESAKEYFKRVVASDPEASDDGRDVIEKLSESDAEDLFNAIDADNLQVTNEIFRKYGYELDEEGHVRKIVRSDSNNGSSAPKKVVSKTETTTPMTLENANVPEAMKTEHDFLRVMHNNAEPVRVPIDKVKLPDTQFKEGADPKTGVVEGQRLQGEYYESAENAVAIYERANGEMELVTGRHRFDLAKRNGKTDILARVFRESDGFTPEDMRNLDAISNIIDEKGSVKDYVNYFDNAKLSRDAAEAGGFLSRQKGRLAFELYEGATEDTRAAVDWSGSGADGLISTEQAGIIASAAPRNAHPRFAAVQKILVGKALNGLRGKKLGILARSLAEEAKNRKETPKVGGEMQLDLFTSEEDQALLAMEDKRAGYRVKKAGEYNRIAEVLRTAVSKGGKLDLNKAYAKELGITNPKDRNQLIAARDKAIERANYWENAVALDPVDKQAMDEAIIGKADKEAAKREEIKQKANGQLAEIKAKREGKKVEPPKKAETEEPKSETEGIRGKVEKEPHFYGPKALELNDKDLEELEKLQNTYSKALKARDTYRKDKTQEERKAEELAFKDASNALSVFEKNHPGSVRPIYLNKSEDVGEPEPKKVVVSKTETTTPMTLENAKKTLGTKFYQDEASLKREMSKLPPQATKAREAYEVALAEARKRAEIEKREKADNDKKPPTQPKGKVKGLELDAATEKEFSDALAEVQFMSEEFNPFDGPGKYEIYKNNNLIARGFFTSKDKARRRGIQLFRGNTSGITVLRVDNPDDKNDIINRREYQIKAIREQSPDGFRKTGAWLVAGVKAGILDATTKSSGKYAVRSADPVGFRRNSGDIERLKSVPDSLFGNSEYIDGWRYFDDGTVLIPLEGETKGTILNLVRLNQVFGNKWELLGVGEHSGDLYAIAKTDKIGRDISASIEEKHRFLSENGFVQSNNSYAISQGRDYWRKGAFSVDANDLSLGETQSGERFAFNTQVSAIMPSTLNTGKAAVDFFAEEFDYEKFGKLVTGVGKLVDILNKKGYKDFASLARQIAFADADKYEKAKSVLQDVWNALAKQKGFVRVSDETADNVYGTIDAELKGEDNGRTNSGDQRSDAGDGGSLAGSLPGDGTLASTKETVRAEGVRGVEEGAGTTGEGAGGGSGLAVGDDRGGRDSSSGRGRRGGRPGNGEEAQGGSGESDRRAVPVRPENGQGEQRSASNGVDAGANGNQGGLDAGGYERGTRGRGSEGESNGVAPSVKKAANKAANKNVPPEHPDFVMTPAVEEAILERSPIKRVMNNVAAIRLLQKLKERDFKATPEEQSTLAKYVGWGGLSEIFTREYEIAWSFEKDGEVERAKNHAKGAKYGLDGYEAFKELRQTLNDEEYADARATTLTAFYTPIPMVRAEHAALRKLGVLGGRFLGPSAGVGNYASAAGEYVKAVNWQFVEKDQVSGQILKALFPNQRVHIGGYEETKLADSFFDFAIDNVPYADVDITDKSLDKGSYKIHDYFFAKTLSKVRPGGVIMFLTSTGTLDKTDGKLRQFLSRNGGKIIGAVRLPNGFFSKNAGTDVASDLVIIQRVSGEADNSGFMQQEKYGETTAWVSRKGQVSVPLTYNKYFADHPEQIVGEMKAGTGQYGRPVLEYKMPSGNLFEQVEAAVDRALAGVDKDAMMKNAPAAVQKDHTPIYDDEGLRQGNITLKDGKVYEKSGDQLVEAEMPTLRPAQKKALAVKGLVPRIVVEKVVGVRKTLRAVVDAQVKGVSDEELKPLIDELNNVYDAFVKKVGTFHDKNIAPFVMLDKADGNRLMTMEKVTKGEDGKTKIEKADILKKRVIFTYQKPTKADTLDDALTISFSETGALDLKRIGELLGVSEEEAETKLKEEGKAFENPQTGRVEPYWEYLSGHVRRKLDAARAATANDPQFRKNVEELEKVQPKDVSLDEVTIKFGATWVDPEAMIDFLKEVYDIRGYASVRLTKNDTLNKWTLELPRSNIEPFGAISFTQEHFLEAVLNSGSLEVKAKDPVTEKYYLLERETEAQKLAAEKLHEAFARFLRTNEKWFEPSSKSFNYAMNDNVAMKLPKDILPLRAAGMNEDTIKKLDAPGREYQPAVIARGVLGGKSLCLAHCVGAGKTLEMQSIGMIGRHLGMFKKSMYVVPNHMLDQFCNEFISAFPNANILKMSTEDVNPKNRRTFFAKVANGDWDAIVVKHSTFSKKLPMTEAWQKEYLQKEVDRLVEAKLAAKGDNGTVKDIEKMIQSAKDKIKKLDGSDQKDNQIVPFEELGVDQLFVDEAHNFKGLPIVSGQARKVKGLAQGDSQRALDMEMKTIYVQSLHGGRRGVVFATGTPLSNAPVVEAYVQLRYLAPWALEEQGIRTFDDFVNAFGKIETESEFGIDGKSTKEVQRVTAFVNIPEMMRLFKSVVDIVNSDQIKVKRPKQVLEAIPVPMSDVQEAVMEMVARESAIPPSKEERQKFLQLSGIAKRVCISPRLVGLDDDGYKIAACANKVKEVYDQTSDKRGAQLIFTDIFNSSESDGVVKYVGSIGGLERDKKAYNLNAALKEMLVRSGIPAEQIGIIHDVDKAKGGDEGKDAAKEELFTKVRSGEIRVLIGSRPRMGEGTNVQERLAAIHLLHPGWKPSEDTQAIGRIIRPGNIYETGKVYYYLTQGNKNVGSYETKNHELIGVKDRLIQAVMHGDETIRTIDLDESAAERDMLMGLASANKDLIELIDVKRVLHKAELNVESVGFSARSNADNAERTRSQLEKLQNEYEDQERGAKEWRKQNPDGSFILTTADGRTLEKPKDIADYVSGEIAKLLAKDRYDREELTEIGNFGGVPLNVNYRFYDNKIHLSIPSIGYAKEIVYAGFIPDFVAQSAVAMKTKVLGLVSPDIEKYHQQILADTKSRISKLESDAKRFNEEYEAENKKLAKLRYEKERLERAVTPLVVKTLESHKWSTYGNWIIGKRDDGYIAQRQTDAKKVMAKTVKDLLPMIDNEDFVSPLQSAKQTMNLPSVANKIEEAVKEIPVQEVDFDTPEFNPDADKPAEPKNDKTFGFTNEEVAFSMKVAGMEPPKHIVKSDEMVERQADALLSNREYMKKLAHAVCQKNRPTRDYENLALGIYTEQCKEALNIAKSAYDEMMQTAKNLPPDTEQETIDLVAKSVKELKVQLIGAQRDFREAAGAKIGGASEQGRALRSNRMLVDGLDYSYAGIRGMVEAELGKKPIPEEMDAEIGKLAENFKDLDEKSREIAVERLKAFSQKVVSDLKRGGKARSNGPKAAGNELKRVTKNYEDAMTQVQIHADEAGGTLIGLADQLYPSWGKWLKAIGEYHCYLNPDITEQGVIDAIREDLGRYLEDGLDETTIRDILTGFGHNFRQSRYDSQRKMNDLKAQALAKRQRDFMIENGKLPPQTGMVRDEPSDETRALRKEVQQLKKDIDEQEGGPRALKGALSSAKTRLRNTIADLERAIANGEKIERSRRSLMEDAELQMLQRRRNELREQYNAIFGEKATLTDEQRRERAEKALRKVLERAMERLGRAYGGDFSVTPRVSRIDSPTIQQLRDEIAQTNRAIRDLKDAAYPDGTPEEIAKKNTRRMAAREEAIQRMQARIISGDIRPQVKKAPPMPADMQARYDALGKELKRAHEKLRQLRQEAKDMLKPSWVRKAGEAWRFMDGIQKMAMASLDFTQVGNQTGSIAMAHPVVAYKSFMQSLPSFLNEINAEDIDNELRSDPIIQEAIDNKWLAWKRAGEFAENRSDRVEFFDAIDRGFKIGGCVLRLTNVPLYGTAIANSDRLYATYINAAAANLYSLIVKDTGLFPKGASSFEKRVVADMVNVMTGSGTLSKQTRAVLGKAMWAPGLVDSQFKRSLGYTMWHPFTADASEDGSGTNSERAKLAYVGAKEFVRSHVGAMLLGGMLLALFGTDDEKYQFWHGSLAQKLIKLMAPRIGHTQLDFTGGEASFYRLGEKLFTGVKETGSGRHSPIRDYFGEIAHFMQGRMNPLVGNVLSAFAGMDYAGQDYGPLEVIGSFAPISIKEAGKSFFENGIHDGNYAMAITAATLVMFGIGKGSYRKDDYRILSNRFREDFKEMTDVVNDPLLTDDDKREMISGMVKANRLLDQKNAQVILNAVKAVDSEERKIKKAEDRLSVIERGGGETEKIRYDLDKARQRLEDAKQRVVSLIRARR